MQSIGQMLEKCDTLRDGKDINNWERGFLNGIVTKYYQQHKSTSKFTGSEVETIEDIYKKYF